MNPSWSPHGDGRPFNWERFVLLTQVGRSLDLRLHFVNLGCLFSLGSDGSGSRRTFVSGLVVASWSGRRFRCVSGFGLGSRFGSRVVFGFGVASVSGFEVAFAFEPEPDRGFQIEIGFEDSTS
jgi:hypothetical protein